jgi:hypothetical protein
LNIFIDNEFDDTYLNDYIEDFRFFPNIVRREIIEYTVQAINLLKEVSGIEKFRNFKGIW